MTSHQEEKISRFISNSNKAPELHEFKIGNVKGDKAN